MSQRKNLRAWTTAILAGVSVFAASASAETLTVPRLPHAPTIEDFQQMAPTGVAAQMARSGEFIQTEPSDGKPPTQRSDAYLGYDDSNLYVVLVCWDDTSKGIRGHMTRREPAEPFENDDYVEVTLDTFRDQRHGFVFDVNPLGVQADGLWTEGQGTDYSWDTLWHSRGHVNSRGYVVWIAIPFRSLRFEVEGANEWGITIARYIARNDETDYWPRVSSTIQGRLNQAGTIGGFRDISPGRNIQFIPYIQSRSFRAADPAGVLQDSARMNVKAGLDSKFVFRDSLVLDTTINPDFAQVESDEPQNTTNERFEVFFPEKRPFFLENSNFFEAPLISVFRQTRMVFTRRIADPSFGSRLTGKQGPWNLGFLVADDRAEGRLLPVEDPRRGGRAYIGVARVSHDVGEQSSIGAMFTDREFGNDFNRVGGLDGAFHLNKNWTATYRGYLSSTSRSGRYLFGQHHEALLAGEGRRMQLNLQYLDITPNFRSEIGFIPRTDQRTLNQYGHFYWRPEGKHLILHGPEQNGTLIWDHTGTTLQQAYSFNYVFLFRPNIVVTPIVAYQSDVLRPNDFRDLSLPPIVGNRQYAQFGMGFVTRGSLTRVLNWDVNFMRGGTPVVIVPSAGTCTNPEPRWCMPYTGDETRLTASIDFKPTSRLQVDNTYVLERVLNGTVQHAVVNSHIIRTKWNYQFNRELSLRVIAQYNGLIANHYYSSLRTNKNVNFDVLFTYLRNPGTAVYVGYNSNMENATLLSGPRRFVNDGRQVFVKVSYLFRR